MKIAAVLVSAALLAATAGCGGGSGGTATAGPSPSSVRTPTCPSVAPSSPPASPALSKLLRSVPFGLPLPPDITPVDTSKTADGIQVVKFTTPSSLREAVIFIVDRFPKAGYVIGRGDAEATEADAPFVKSGLRGLARVASLQTCQTLWLIASVATTGSSGGTSPLLSPHPTSSQTTALPFG